MNASTLRRADHRRIAPVVRAPGMPSHAPFRSSHSRDTPRWIATTLAISLLLACAESPTAARPLPNVERSNASASLPDADAYTGEYSWLQGQGPAFLGSAAARVCFLTSVSGNLDGPSEWVGVYSFAGNWYLNGGSQTNGVGAKARCLHTSSYGAEITLLSTGGVKTRVLAGDVCALTRIGGKLDTYLDRVRVHVNPAVSPYKLTLHVTAATGGYVTGRVRCIGNPVSATHVRWVSPAPPQQVPAVASLCFLTGMGGAFGGSADWVWAIKTTSAWYLMGNRSNLNLSAFAGCIR